MCRLTVHTKEEFAISFLMMMIIIILSHHTRSCKRQGCPLRSCLSPNVPAIHVWM